MAPRLRAKPATHARMQRAATQFNELEVTPSRYEEQPRGIVSTAEEQGARSANPFSWSDAGSTSNTRRSSPAEHRDVPLGSLWQFDDHESLDPFSSPGVADSFLPATIPFHETEGNGSTTPRRHIDFSETASTAHRSSPFATSDVHRGIWDFGDSPKVDNPSPNTTSGISGPSPAHPPVENLYDVTPRKPAAPAPASADQSVHESKGLSQPEPIRFDVRTQEIVNVPTTKKSAAPRLPIVRALQESAAASISPTSGSKKRKPRKPVKSRPAKKAAESHPAQTKLPPPGSTRRVAPSSSLAAVLIRSSSASIEPPCAEKPGEVNASLPANTCDGPAAIPEPNHHQHPPSVAVDNGDNNPEAVPIEQHKPKRRRISRQFSVSERGSPVVVKDTAPSRKIEYVPPQLDPIVTSISEQQPAVQRPSFLRSESTDKQIEQQHDSAFGDIQGKSSSQWLRRLSDKEPVQKRKTSMGKKLHDEIMKSFLGNTDLAPEAQEATLARAAGGVEITHVNKQIRLTIEQLIARLDDKKAAAYNVADVYRGGGKESLSIVKQRLFKDRDSLAVAFSGQGVVFHTKVQEVKEIVKTRSQARTESASDLDEVLAARRQAHGRVRQGLRALRDELLRNDRAVVGLT
ncbi:hypothetical protein J3F83DRAFT_759985 [Trichoderma novae-zelandiae]